MTAILVTGAFSGLGRCIVQTIANLYPTATIYALDRLSDSDASTSATASSQIRNIQLDVTDDAAVEQLARDFDAQDVALRLVVHSAGVRGLEPSVPILTSNDVARAETIEVMTADTLRFAFDVNAVGFFLLAKALVPALRRGAHIADVFSCSTPRVIVLGSRMGSIGHNKAAGGAYAYRASKAALNAIVKSLSIDVPEAIWTIIHPGRVETGLVAVKEDGAISVEEASDDLLSLVWRLRKDDSGRFLDRFGNDVPW